MSNITRLVLKTDTNVFDPTVLSNTDGPGVARKLEDLLGRASQGACAANLSVATAPIAAVALVNTTNGSETASDTLTVAGIAITLETSGAAGASKQVNIAAGTKGTSTSGASPAITTASATLQFNININGDGPQLLMINDAGTHTGAQIASQIQTAIRALTAINSNNAVAYSSATCTYGSTYVITSGAAGNNSSVVVTGAGAATLKLGVFNGGAEVVGNFTTLNAIAALINGQTLTGGFTTKSAAWNGICTAFVCGANMWITAALPGTMGNGLALAVSSTGSIMTITSAFGVAVAGTEGKAGVFSIGL